MINQDELNNLAADFQQWRTIRKYPKEKTPQTLKDRVIKLSQCYSPGQIQATLNLSSSTFNKWRKQLSAITEANDFITLPEVSTPIPVKAPTSTEINVELTCRNGNSLQLSGAISIELLTAITKEVLA